MSTFKIEIAKSGMAKCKECGNKIEKGALKIVRMGFNQYAGRPSSESICRGCGEPIVLAEISQLQSFVDQLKGNPVIPAAQSKRMSIF